jgi:hypothetical protein
VDVGVMLIHATYGHVQKRDRQFTLICAFSKSRLLKQTEKSEYSRKLFVTTDIFNSSIADTTRRSTLFFTGVLTT